MKKKKGPLILICVLVLLLILYFVLSTWNKKQDSKEEETVKVTDLKTSKITGVKYDLGTGEMNFEKDEDTWYYTADKDFPLRQSYPKTVADAMGQLSADRELEDADALEEYGLDHPTYTVTLHFIFCTELSNSMEPPQHGHLNSCIFSIYSQKNSHSICSNSRMRKMKLPGVISFLKLLPT